MKVCLHLHDKIVTDGPLENKNLENVEDIEKSLQLGEFIRDGELILLVPFRMPSEAPIETLALIKLSKYRHLKRMYPNQSSTDPIL